MTGQKAIRALGYCRVSTDEQAESGAGLAAQEATVLDAAQARGFTLLEVVHDAGWSAKTLARPGITRVLEALDARQAEVLVVARLDRLSRSLADFAGVLERARRRGWQLVAVDLGVDTTTPAGELVANVMAAVAQWERRAIGVRTAEAMAQKKAAGVHLGRRSTLPEETVARIIEERLAGRTFAAIAEGLTRDGRRTGQGAARWQAASVRAVFRRRSAQTIMASMGQTTEST
jgi:DNA invertase Pin-like site-specific DNA recombinase